MISVIVPAHNEEQMIGKCLSAMTRGVRPGEVEIVVACNGCSDRTADVARSFGPVVEVLEIPVASKVAALNAGDRRATGFPRFYIDADVVIDMESIRVIVKALDVGDSLMANPSVRTNVAQSSWPVRAFYRVWQALPYNNENGMVGTGVYALTRAGRSRFGEFPDIIADDAFVRFHFAKAERIRVATAFSQVEAPRDLQSLVRVRTRGRIGGYQLRAQFPEIRASDRRSPGRLLMFLLGRPDLWFDLPWYVAITLISRLRARLALRSRASHIWARDDSSRQAEAQ